MAQQSGKRTTPKTTAARKAAPKKASAARSTAKKAPAKRVTAKKATPKRAPAKRSPRKRAAAKKVTNKRAPAKRAPTPRVRAAAEEPAEDLRALDAEEGAWADDPWEEEGASWEDDEEAGWQGDEEDQEAAQQEAAAEEQEDVDQEADEGEALEEAEAEEEQEAEPQEPAEDPPTEAAVEVSDVEVVADRAADIEAGEAEHREPGDAGPAESDEEAAWNRLATEDASRVPTPPAAAEKQATGAGLVVLSLVALVLCPFLVLPIVALVSANKEQRRHRRRARAARAIATLALALGIAIDIGIAVVVLTKGEGGVSYTSFKPGQCFDYPPENFTRAKVVACTGPHNLEVFGTATAPSPKGTPYPGSDALVQVAAVACAPGYTSYVGVAPDQSSLPQVEIVPQKATWDDGNRKLVCAVGTAGTKTSGSVKDSRR